MSLILGVDPGSRVAGYGVIRVGRDLEYVAHGVVVMPEKLSFAERLAFLRRELAKIFAQFHPRYAVVEKVFLGKNADSAFKLGHARGVCLEVAADHGCEVIEYAARTVKQMVTGSGSASKEHVQVIVANLLRLKKVGTIDAFDALAIALTHARELEMAQVLSRQSPREGSL